MSMKILKATTLIQIFNLYNILMFLFIIFTSRFNKYGNSSIKYIYFNQPFDSNNMYALYIDCKF